MVRIAIATLLCLVAGCGGTAPPRQPSVCSTQPGSFACQVERYSSAGM